MGRQIAYAGSRNRLCDHRLDRRARSGGNEPTDNRTSGTEERVRLSRSGEPSRTWLGRSGSARRTYSTKPDFLLLSSPDQRALPPRRDHGAYARAHDRAPRDDAAGVVDVGPRCFVRRPKTAEETVGLSLKLCDPSDAEISRIRKSLRGGGGRWRWLGERPAPVRQPNQPAAVACHRVIELLVAKLVRVRTTGQESKLSRVRLRERLTASRMRTSVHYNCRLVKSSCG
jgi:hypothetical protein